MFERVETVAHSGADLIDAKARLAIRRLEAVGVKVALQIAISLIAAAGVLTLVAALSIWVSRNLGPAVGVGVGGLVLLMIAAAIHLAARSKEAPRPSVSDLERDAIIAKQAFKESFKPKPDPTASPKATADEPPWASVLRALQPALSNPGVLIGVAAAALSIFGPVRLVRTVGRLVAAAGMASTLTGTLSQLMGSNKSPGRKRPVKGDAVANGRSEHHPQNF